MAAHAVHAVRIDGEGLKSGPRKILSVFGKLLDGRVREVQPDLHDLSIEQPSEERTPVIA